MTRALKAQDFKDRVSEVTIGDAAAAKLISDLAEYALSIERQLIMLENYRFGRSSEKYIDPRQPSLFDEAEDLESEVADAEDTPETGEIPAKKKQPKRRRPKLDLPDSLPRNVRIHEIAPENRICPCCSKVMPEIGEESTEKLHIVPSKFEVNRDIYKKYACRSCQEPPVQSSREDSALSRIKASEEAVAFIAVQKYLFATPLYRLEQLFSASKISLSRYVMSLWMIKLAEVLRPVYGVFENELLARNYMHMDETTVQVLREPGRSATSKSQMWIRTSGVMDSQGPPIALYTYDQSRSAAVASSLIGKFQGIIQTDDYAGYSSALKSSSKVTHVLCWDHARRYFWHAFQALNTNKRAGSTSEKVLTLIGKLYEIEADCKTMSVKERQAQREARSLAVLDELRTYCENRLGSLASSSPTAKAINYLLSNWEKLTIYTSDGRINISNSPAEQRVRPFAIGRKNFLFSNTPRGAESSAIIYSVIETLKLNGGIPYDELLRILKTIGNNQGRKLTIKDVLPYRTMGQ